MALIQFILSLVVLGILYMRMVKREVPEPISTLRAVIPVALGVISLPLSFVLVLGISAGFMTVGLTADKLPDLARPFFSSFFAAGFPEEIAKLGMLLLALFIHRSRIKNVYECVLAGAGVGFGFTLFEEFLYGSESIVIAVIRLLTVTAHMLFGIIMGKHIGMAKLNKARGSGPVVAEYAKGILIPMLIHTLFDASNAQNRLLVSDNETLVYVGIAISFAALVIMFVLQFVILIRLKQDTEALCEEMF